MSKTGNLTADQTTGRCLCGGLRFKFDPAAIQWTCNCYCESCRRATGSPVSTFISVADTGWRWVSGRPAYYASSPGVQRGFCATCGTSMSYATDSLPGETHFYAVTLIDPSRIEPEYEFAKAERVHWCDLGGSLPQK